MQEATSPASIAARVRLVAHERGLAGVAVQAALKAARYQQVDGLVAFCESEGLWLHWLVTGDLRWHPGRRRWSI